MSESESPNDPRSMAELAVDRDNLYREDVVTDLRAATIRRLVPIRADGSDDPSRETLFLAETQLLTQAGLLPVQARLESTTLAAALDEFPNAIQKAVDRMVEEAREMQRREASRIVVPTPDLTGGPLGPGGKIQLR
ncbi:MAG: hypothetical protein R3E88_08970 [Myxococcota bacterium]